MTVSLNEWRQRVEQRKGGKLQLEQSISRLKKDLRQLRRETSWAEQAQELIRQAAQITQQQLQYHLSGLVSMCLDSVFLNPYELRVEFVLRRNKTEADVQFYRNENLTTRTGFGVKAVASFGLRTSLWSLATPQSRNVILLDEPFRDLKDPTQRMQTAAREVMMDLSKSLNLQFIIIEHDPAISSGADKIFQITKRKDISEVKII